MKKIIISVALILSSLTGLAQKQFIDFKFVEVNDTTFVDEAIDQINHTRHGHGFSKDYDYYITITNHSIIIKDTKEDRVLLEEDVIYFQLDYAGATNIETRNWTVLIDNGLVMFISKGDFVTSFIVFLKSKNYNN